MNPARPMAATKLTEPGRLAVFFLDELSPANQHLRVSRAVKMLRLIRVHSCSFVAKKLFWRG
jgi:hypothetical protein